MRRSCSSVRLEMDASVVSIRRNSFSIVALKRGHPFVKPHHQFSALASFFITEEMDDETRFHRWAALIWTALIFIEDACNTCPEYTARQKSWRYLRQAVTTLAEKLLQIEAAVDEDGTAMYEAIWEAA